MDVILSSATRMVTLSLLLPALGVSIVSLCFALGYGALQLQDTVLPLMGKVMALAILLFLLSGPIADECIEMFRHSYQLVGDINSS